MENSTEEYKIQSFDQETQMLLKTALKDPCSVDLEKVSNIIVDQSMKDQTFSKEAGRICYTIVQAEAKQNNGNIFRRNLLNRLQQEFKNREETRKHSIQEWVCYVTFICNIFDYLKVNNMPMVALVHPVYDCLMRVAQPDALMNEEEVMALEPNSNNSVAFNLNYKTLIFIGPHIWISVSAFFRWTVSLCSYTGLGNSWKK